MSDSIFLTDGNGAIAGLVAGKSYSGDLVIPEYVAGERITSIADDALDGYTGLVSVTFPNSLTSIGNYALRNCTNLTSIIIPNSVTSIKYRAFWGCAKLTFIAIPDSVTSIGGEAFAYCPSLATVYVDDPSNISPAVNAYNWSNSNSAGVSFASVYELYRVSRLVINKLTLDQYKAAKSAGHIAENEVYVITDIDEVANSKAPMYTYGTTDLEAGVTTLETGKLHFVYE